jgi:transcriptional regulator with PAS, ATPase and Fis domain
MGSDSMEPVPGAASNGWPLIIGVSEGILHAKDLVVRTAKTGAPSLVVGETGTGKELFVEAIHVESGRSGPLVRVNCAAIPETLFESELFGHEMGSFSGAHRTRPGLFEEAHRGTLHLDEIGDLPLLVQAKLLRVLDRGEIRRVGGNRTRVVDVRIVAATNRNLEREVADGRFREDLYARLDVVRIYLPPLRERAGDIPLLVEHFAGAGRVTPEAMPLLEAYDWPRNVRELKFVVEPACTLAAPGPVQPEHLPDRIRYADARTRAREGRNVGRLVTLAEVEREHVLAVIAHANGNVSEAARILGIARHTLARRLIEYGWSGGSGGGAAAR